MRSVGSTPVNIVALRTAKRLQKNRQIALAPGLSRSHTRGANEQAKRVPRHSCRHLHRRGSFRGGPFRDSATARADSRCDWVTEPRMRGHAPNVRQLPAHAERNDLARAAGAARGIRSHLCHFSVSQRAPRLFSARTRAAGSFLTIGAPLPWRGQRPCRAFPRVAEPMRAERKQLLQKSGRVARPNQETK